MFKFFILLFFSLTLLFGANPAPYSNLGDEIYNSLEDYKKLSQQLPEIESIINSYINNASQVKKLGFEAEAKPELSKRYLLALREVDSERQMILTQLNASLYRAMDNRDKKSFTKLIRSHFIDLDKVGDDVIPFYKKNFKSGTIEEIESLVKNENRYKKDAKRANKEYTKRVEEKRIERMREASVEADRSREDALNREVDMQRQEINSMMENELIR